MSGLVNANNRANYSRKEKESVCKSALIDSDYDQFISTSDYNKTTQLNLRI